VGFCGFLGFSPFAYTIFPFLTKEKSNNSWVLPTLR
jgi:hypothetical protein